MGAFFLFVGRKGLETAIAENVSPRAARMAHNDYLHLISKTGLLLIPKDPACRKRRSQIQRAEKMEAIGTRLAKNLTHISGSPAHLSKTIVSLISNAVEAMPDGGDIVVSTENRYLDKPIRGYSHVAPGDYVVINVSDTGTGLSTEDVERIFEPFYTKKKMGRSGTGLGMAVVWGVVEDHKGYIDVQNKQGRGTVFSLYFPAIPRELPEDKSGLSISSIMGNGESILIVDDVRELPKNNLRILFALLPVFYVVKTGT